MRGLLFIIVTLAIAYVFTQYFLPILGGFTAIFTTVLTVVLFGVTAYIVLTFFMNPRLSQEMPSYRIVDKNKTYVTVFRNDPQARELSTEEDSEYLQRIVTSGRTCRVDNNTEILVLDDTHPRLVKIRIIEGDFRGHDGWIWREDLAEVRGGAV